MPKRREIVRKLTTIENEMYWLRRQKSKNAGAFVVNVKILDVQILLMQLQNGMKRRSIETHTHAGKKRLYAMLRRGNL